MTFRDIADILEDWAPLSFAENYDNVGLIVGEQDTTITGALINLDLTHAVIEEAIQKQCNIIITHHPIWFNARKRLNGEDYVSKLILQAIRNNIGLYAIHTNLDNIKLGVNYKMAEKLKLHDCHFLAPKLHFNIGSGMIGHLPFPFSKKEFLQKLKEVFGCQGIRYADTYKDKISTVAICGGSGSFLIEEALRQGADAFVTGDVTYHKFFDSENQLLYVDIGHYESEQFTSELILEFLQHKNILFPAYLSTIRTNPVLYFA